MLAEASIPSWSKSFVFLSRNVGDMGTCLDDIDANVLSASIDLLPYKFRRRLVYSSHTCRVLGRQSSRGSHSITAMSGGDFLVGFQPSIMPIRVVAA